MFSVTAGRPGRARGELSVRNGEEDAAPVVDVDLVVRQSDLLEGERRTDGNAQRTDLRGSGEVTGRLPLGCGRPLA